MHPTTDVLLILLIIFLGGGHAWSLSAWSESRRLNGKRRQKGRMLL